MPSTTNRTRRSRQQRWADRRRGGSAAPSQPFWRRWITSFRGHSTPWKVIVELSAVAVLLLGIVSTDALRMYTSIHRVDLHLAGAGDGSTNYLLIGSDTRTHIRTLEDLQTFGSPFQSPGTHADQILVLNIAADGTVRLVAIARDLLIDVPGKGEQRITLTLDDGPQVFVDSLCASLGLGVDHVAIIGFDGFRSIVDAVGGVDVVLPIGLRSSALGLELHAGPNHLDAHDALALVRLRSGEQLGLGGWIPLDQGARTRTQSGELVFRSIAAKVSEERSPFALRSIIAGVSDNLTIDSGIGMSQMLELRDALGRVGSTDLTMLQAQTIDGDTPVAYLEPGATETLQSIGAGTNPKCPNLPRIEQSVDAGMSPDQP